MSKRVRKAILILVVLLGCALLVVTTIKVDCALRDSLTPSAPIYPDSTLVEEPIFDSSASIGSAEYIYETSDSPEQVGKFYDERAGCVLVTQHSNMRCHARITPFGVYDVSIDYESKPTTYRVDIAWDKCDFNDFWDNISVES